jgi:hypothetical protein
MFSKGIRKHDISSDRCWKKIIWGKEAIVHGGGMKDSTLPCAEPWSRLLFGWDTCGYSQQSLKYRSVSVPLGKQLSKWHLQGSLCGLPPTAPDHGNPWTCHDPATKGWSWHIRKTLGADTSHVACSETGATTVEHQPWASHTFIDWMNLSISALSFRKGYHRQGTRQIRSID